jgi:hypothetical protein
MALIHFQTSISLYGGSSNATRNVVSLNEVNDGTGAWRLLDPPLLQIQVVGHADESVPEVYDRFWILHDQTFDALLNLDAGASGLRRR